LRKDTETYNNRVGGVHEFFKQEGRISPDYSYPDMVSIDEEEQACKYQSN
jgi:hypothetical protein